ncbi:U4/U6-U5 snRNP complex subunit PRP3 [Lachancea thermotolerans CBS 6340]|uniref:KLTH0G05610p n=1 Tax=Lachancea thermotolerans (strain ATCC 56472 / CBS 6340 / NRRL Y-8284) TaxID=559295 RepID=C5DM33_LACTC|nr:KLTH0G05610p [Lachancea thermotolerans CBS 6340]CAR24844.1 KLTH0G05610p [Lachancea thermotolerans CBS 6340]
MRARKEKGNSSSRDGNSARFGAGLDIDIHPALLSENLNLIKHRDNPYLSRERFDTVASKVSKRYSRGLKFRTPGVLAKELDEKRAWLAKERELQKEQDNLRKAKVRAGELPDESIGEQNYLITDVPQIEWWDAIYVQSPEDWTIKTKYSKSYGTMDEDSDDEQDSESESPSVRYVQHPVPVQAAEHAPSKPKIYLVKREQKKIRRNRRKLLQEEHEQKIKLGLEPKPAPKVKLSNMMSVYQNNENITDPTSWEQTVKAQAEERHQKHVETNIRRHYEAKEQKKEKAQEAPPAQAELHCRVFRFSSLRNPKIRFKLAKNSRQLGLRGVCLRVGDGAGIIVVIGSEKNCRFYSKLVLQRIDWTQSYVDKDSQQFVDCSGDEAELLWEGVVKDTRFRGWFMKECRDESELQAVLSQFDADWLLRV